MIDDREQTKPVHEQNESVMEKRTYGRTKRARSEIGIAVIGAGWMGQAHCQAYRRIPGLYPHSGATPRLKMIVDIAEPLGRSTADRYEIEQYASDWRQALSDSDIQAVDICVGNWLHEPIAIAAAEAGKHVFCEKPLAISIAEAQRMVAAVEKAGIVNRVGFSYRHIPANLTAKEIIESGALGEIVHFRTVFAQDFAASENVPLSWRFDARQAGSGSLATLGSHSLDLIRFLVGDVRSLTAMTRTFIGERQLPDRETMATVDVDDMTGMLLQFEAGASGLLETTWLAHGHKHHMSWEANGRLGSLQYNSQRMNELEWYDARDGGTRPGFRTLLMGPGFPEADAFVAKAGMGMGYADSFVIELKHFLSAVAGEVSSGASFHDGLEVCRLTEAALISSREQRWVDLGEIT